MQDNRIHLPVTNPDPQTVTHVEVSVLYSKGGSNYWTGGQDRRGYYTIVTPVRISGNMKGFTIGAGLKQLIEQVERLNKKRFEQVKSQVEEEIRTRQGASWDLVQKVCEQAKVEIAHEQVQAQ